MTTAMSVLGIGPMALVALFPSTPLAAHLEELFPVYLVLLVFYWFMLYRGSLATPMWQAEELAKIGGVEAVGTLIDLVAMSVPNARVDYSPLHAALADVLLKLKAGDAHLLSPDNRKILHTTLSFGFRIAKPSVAQQQYMLAVVKALEQVGDADAVPIIQAIANGRAKTAFQQELKTAAEQCLPMLYVHVNSAAAEKSLLRASSPEKATSEMLLRAAGATPVAAPEQLLRPPDDPSAEPGSMV